MSHIQKEDCHFNDFMDPIFSNTEQVRGNDGIMDKKHSEFNITKLFFKVVSLSEYVTYIEMIYISHFEL